MPASAADLPDSFVGFLPDILEMFEESPLQGPRLGVLGQAATQGLVEGVHDLAEDVELELAVRRVADTHRP
jgi:hypothetical protein